MKPEMLSHPAEGSTPRPPSCEIITIGTELLIGQILDTNTTYLAQELSRIGVTISFRTAVGDHLGEMTRVIRSASDRCDMVVITGGLGPTLDDLTREAVAEVAGVELVFQQDLMDQIEAIFQKVGYQMPDNNRRQAYVPEGSHIIPNPVGTAPAFISETHDIPIICLPGVPRELEYLLGENVIPWIKRRFELDRHTLIYRVLKAVGIGESKVDRLIGDLIRPGANPEVGLLASMGEIKIRIAARAANQREAEGLIKPVESEIRNRLNHKIYGQDEDSLEGVVNAMLTAGGLSLAILETFSGASVAGRLHRIPCKMLLESRIITEEPQLKAWLGQDMDDETTPDLARTAAHRMRKNVRADVGLAILGFARETGRLYSVRGSVAVAGKGLGSSFSWEMGGDLFTLQQRAGVIGLNTLRLALLKSKNRGQSLTSPS